MEFEGIFAILPSFGTTVVAVGCGIVAMYVVIIGGNFISPKVNSLIRRVVTKRFASAGVRIGQDIVIHDERAFWAWAKSGSLGFGETYMAKMWDTGSQPLEEIVAGLAQLPPETKRKMFKAWNWRIFDIYYRLFNMQSVSRADIIAKKHYNLGNEFFSAWLDSNMQYSCGYWDGVADPDDIDAAQVNKMNLIARKLQLEPGMTVVDVGCGWGTLSCFLASNYGVKVTGVNISTEQVKFARELVAQRGLANQVTFILDDYRNLSGKFDRLVTVGFLEHVGLMNLPEFFDVAHRVLKPGGLALVQSITNGKTVHVQADQFIHKYIFPNGYLPSPKLLVKYAESKFVVEDMQNFGVDYMRTLQVWHKRFKACVDKGIFDPEKQDETFVRMWEFYLLYCTGAFKARITHLYQVVYSKKRPEIYIAPR